MRRLTIIIAGAMFCQMGVAGLREDFAKTGDTGSPDGVKRVAALLSARCAMLVDGGLAAFKPYGAETAPHGLELIDLSPVDARAFAVAQAERDGMRIYGFSERGGSHARELAIKTAPDLPIAGAEVWDPRQGTFERPFSENGVIRLGFNPNETLFLVWEKEPVREPSPMRMTEIVGREERVRVTTGVKNAEDGGRALEGAAWIWHPDAQKEKGVATLRTAFEMPEGRRDVAALTFSCDNGAEVRINGQVVARQDNASAAWQKLTVVKDVRSFLFPGRNVIEATCENIVPGDAGLIASLDMVVGGKPVRIFTNDRSWEASLDGTRFTKAWQAGVYGDEPWLRFNAAGVATQKPLPRVGTTELSFSFGHLSDGAGKAPPGRLFFVCDGLEGGGGCAVTVNDTFAGGCLGAPYTLDVTRFLKRGRNTLRVTPKIAKNPRLVWMAPAKGVYDLRCEYLAEPLGVVKPRFFWKWAGERPKPFRLTVAPIPAPTFSSLLTGVCETTEHLYVVPEMMRLTPFTRYWWSVQGGENFVPCPTGSFVTGIEKWEKPFFKPPWQHDQTEYWIARKRVTLNGARSVIVALASLGSHRLYVNGLPASEGFGPNRSHVEDGILLAETYDVTELVREGENELTVYLHDGWARLAQCKEKESCLSVDGRAVTTNGVVVIDSAEPWEVSLSADRSYGPIDGNCNGRRRGIEHLCDKERETRQARGVVRTGPDFSVSCDVSERDYAIRAIKPVSIEETATPGKWKIDMGEAFSGFMRLKLKGEKGRVARMTVSDTFVDECVFGQISEFEFCGGDGLFENRLNTQSGRFFYLTGCEKPGLDDVTGIVIGCCGRITGGFTGDRDLETVLALDRDTFIATTMGGVTVDCPHRERLGYGEASLSAMWGDGIPQFDSAAYYYAYLVKWASSQRPDGSIPHVSPNGYGWGGTFWSNFPVYALEEYSRRYPDARLKAVMRPVIDRWLDYLHAHVGKDGILAQYEPKKGDCLGDWLYPEIHKTKGTSGDWGHTVEGMFFNNCSYAWAIKEALAIEGLVTDAARRDELKRRHAALVAAIDREWYREGLYVSEDARYQAIALVAGAAEAGGHLAETERAMQDIVAWKGYVDGGSPSYTVILRALCASRRGRELALRTFRRREAPGFLFFADEGYNTIPEDWWYGRKSHGSMIHTCYTGPAGALFHGFAGLEVEGNRVTVAPLLSDTLPNFSAYTETLYGTLAVRVEARGVGKIVWVTCPDGCEGSFIGTDGEHPLKPGLNRFAF
ncbi:MAG: alpha-L-rhamnosidase N-terminal domain-containing protein [Kiritimatiellae bacterium]|nr:alpha-L-rhamnosidase N-terminal domain-containing protein [Kiritimatiellia bacterium]